MTLPASVRRFGNTPVPNTAAWSAEWNEGKAFLAPDPDFPSRYLAICQPEAQGEGKPLFGKPHMQRQRRAIAHSLCDLCGRSLATSTKVSLSHARPQPHGAHGLAILQVEPMLHRACAAASMRSCPSLRADIREGTLRIRQVLRYRVQCGIMDAPYVESLTGQRVLALGHAKVELIVWKDRDEAWLSR